MMRKRNNIVVGLTTINNEMLKISIPALAKLQQKFLLIVHNDNPMTTVSKRQIRKLGYCGDLQIINSTETLGELKARFEIIKFARTFKPEWIVFCNDDDLLIDLEIPEVSDDTFAIIQNAIVLHHNVGNLLKVMENPKDFDVDGENVTLLRPNIGVCGTPIRSKILFELAKILPDIEDGMKKLEEKLDFYPPINSVMWNYVNTYAHHINKDYVPIYMDKINYIKNALNNTRMKYGRLAFPARNADDQYRRVVSKYNDLLKEALSLATAPLG